MAVNIKLKHSSVDGKAPVASDASEGELLLNINENSPAAYIKDSAGNIVKLAGAGSVTVDDAVIKSETASQNVAGNLTLGTDKITLDASDGKATFADNVSTTNGVFYATRSSGAGKAFVGRTGASENAIIYADGQATFTGKVTALDGVAVDSNVSIYYQGSNLDRYPLEIKSNVGGTAKTQFEVRTDGTTYIGGDVPTDPNIELGSSGAAMFKGTVESHQSTASVNLFKGGYGNGGDMFVVRGNGTIVGHESGNATTGNFKYKIDSNGAATFADSSFVIDNNGVIQTNIRSSGILELDSTGLFTSPKITLRSNDGTGDFAGSIKAGERDPAAVDTRGVRIAVDSSNGGCYVQAKSTATPSAIMAFQALHGTNEKFKVMYDGSSVFTGQMRIGGDITTTSGTRIYNNGAIYIRSDIGSTNSIFKYYNGSFTDSDVKIDFRASGAADFASNVTVGTYDSSQDDGQGSRLGGGGVAVQRASTQGNPDKIATFTSLLGQEPRARIFADGGANFRGNVQSGDIDIAENTASGVHAFSAGQILVQRAGTSSNLVFAAYQGQDERVNIQSSGAAAFQSAVKAYDTSSGRNVTAGLCRSFNGLSYGLTIAPANNENTLAASISATGEASFKGRVYSTRASNTSCFQAYTTGDSQAKIDLNSNGDATFFGTVTATNVPPSDARFKENITPAKPQLADVVALGGLLKNYDWNDDAPLNEELRSQRQLGLIAQEAAEVCPAIVKDIHATKQGAVITPEKTIPAVYEDKVIPAVYETVVTPAKLGPRGKEIVPESTEEVLVTPERTEQVLVTPEQVIAATYETLDNSYKGISTDALIMKLIGAVAELSAEVTALKAAKLTKN